MSELPEIEVPPLHHELPSSSAGGPGAPREGGARGVDRLVPRHRGGQAVRSSLEALAGHRIYCTTGVTALRQVVDARSWTATVWKGRASSMALDGTKVKVNNLRGALDASDDPWRDLGVFLNWIGERGIRPATVGTMATNLWRSTLPSPVAFDSDPVTATPAFYGGRQEATPETTDTSSTTTSGPPIPTPWPPGRMPPPSDAA